VAIATAIAAAAKFIAKTGATIPTDADAEQGPANTYQCQIPVKTY
jgi:hypothetical protein